MLVEQNGAVKFTKDKNKSSDNLIYPKHNYHKHKLSIKNKLYTHSY